MTPPIAVQLYSVREALSHDFEGVIRRIAAMGYAGVETAGFPGTTPAAAATLFRSLGLAVPSAHSALPVGDQQRDVLDTLAALGCTTLVCPYLDPNTYFKSIDGVMQVVEMLNAAAEVTRAHGLKLAYHNHDFEYMPVEGTYPYRVMLDNLAPDILFEIDVYWVQTAGHDPAAIIREIGARAPLLHIKDGPAVRGQPMVAVGDGTLDIPAIVRASDWAEWLIVELDACATDMLIAVERSFRYLADKGLGHGR